MKTEDEIQDKADQAASAEREPKYFGQTYEAGVRAALDWVLNDEGDENDPL